MMKAREEGWKHLRSSQESTDSDVSRNLGYFLYY